MFQLVRTLRTLDVVVRQVPVFVISFLIASFFYKFGSFALEALAFLATWFVLDALVEAGGVVRTKLTQSHPGREKSEDGTPRR
ncbi:hypothetical protein ACFWAY_17855 [Rhodococcus sp. NPDC059968]|uniref:hypothetical protein n=1 Tax=Rhodococcus sp. NPDC059968 TaxID=3347017 RepID=UPI003671E594